MAKKGDKCAPNAKILSDLESTRRDASDSAILKCFTTTLIFAYIMGSV